MSELPLALAQWASLSGPALVVAAARKRAEGGFGTEKGPLRLDLTPDQRREVGRLLGSVWQHSGREVPLQILADRLSIHGLSVRGLVELLGGPIENRRDSKKLQATAAHAQRAEAIQHLTELGLDQVVVQEWLATAGLPKEDLVDFVQRVAMVWRLLPSGPGSSIRLAQLAAMAEKDAHALDADQALGRAVVRLIADTTGQPRPNRGGPAWRNVWRAARVQCDLISSRVLALNIPVTPTSQLGRVCATARGEPIWLTQRMLTTPWSAYPADIWVCENPNVIEAAADAHGAAGAAMVCTDGVPAGAALDLLVGLAEAGAQLRVRADFDTTGVRIVERLVAEIPSALLWRFDATTYWAQLPDSAVAALSLTRGTQESSPADNKVAQELDLLKAAFQSAEMVVHEEQLLGFLLQDVGPQ